MTTSFLIGPVKDALRRDTKPWAIPEDAFETLTNAYQWRGRIVKRSGYTLLGNLANGTPVMGLRTQEGFNLDVQTLIAFDTTTTYKWNGTAFVALPSVMPVVWSGTNYQFFFTTNYAASFWATNDKSGLNGWGVSLFSGSAGVGNLATVEVTSLGNAVMVGDYVYFINLAAAVSANAAVLAKVTIAGNPFTVTAVNQPAGSTFAWTNGATATGMVLDSMQTVTGQDGIRYYGSLTNGTGWANYNPPIDPVNALAGALLIFAYRGYLIFLNTWEGNDGGVFNYGNRARWTQIGTPYYSFPVPSSPNPQTVDINAMRDDLFGRGGAYDAPTNEVIIGAQFVRDILVVFFERSTWRLRFVNNSQNPFVWERVNIELGGDCTFSVLNFDKGAMSISQRGIVICDSNDTIRFDEKIPDEIFQIRQANNGLQRVYGIRTFETKLCYWTYPSSENPNGVFPDKVLLFNYETKNWSYYDDCFTCFGYYYPGGSGITWEQLTNAWSETSETWDGGFSQEGFENIVAGNQQGFVFILEATDGVNAPSLNISAITAASPGVFTSVNNNLPDETWITLSGIMGTTSDDGISLNGRNFKISKALPTTNTFTISEFKSILGGNAVGIFYTFTISYQNLLAGYAQINVGSLVFTDPAANGVLVEASGLGNGTINYITGVINLSFNPPIGSSPVIIRIVSFDPLQELAVVNTIGAYGGGGQIAKISNMDIQTKIFNFFNDDRRSRLSKIDFYVDSTSSGQFTCNVFADSSNFVANTPLSDNAQSNIVLTSTNPYQIGQGDETIYRLYCDVLAQTVQLQLTYQDQQMAANSANQADLQILAMMFTLRQGGRLP